MGSSLSDSGAYSWIAGLRGHRICGGRYRQDPVLHFPDRLPGQLGDASRATQQRLSGNRKNSGINKRTQLETNGKEKYERGST